MRKKILASILLAGFIGISFFGFFSMKHKHESRFELHSCLAQTLQGKSCPTGSKSLSFAIFHIEAIKSFFLVIFSNIFIFGINFFALLAFFIPYLFKKSQHLVTSALLHLSLREKIFLKNTFFSKAQILFWSALHELSPTVS